MSAWGRNDADKAGGQQPTSSIALYAPSGSTPGVFASPDGAVGGEHHRRSPSGSLVLSSLRLGRTAAGVGEDDRTGSPSAVTGRGPGAGGSPGAGNSGAVPLFGPSPTAASSSQNALLGDVLATGHARSGSGHFLGGDGGFAAASPRSRAALGPLAPEDAQGAPGPNDELVAPAPRVSSRQAFAHDGGVLPPGAAPASTVRSDTASPRAATLASTPEAQSGSLGAFMGGLGGGIDPLVGQFGTFTLGLSSGYTDSTPPARLSSTTSASAAGSNAFPVPVRAATRCHTRIPPTHPTISARFRCRQRPCT